MSNFNLLSYAGRKITWPAKSLGIIVSAVSILCLTESAWADSMYINGFSSQPYLEQISITYNGNNETVYTGGISGTLNGNNTVFFCYDLNHTINVSQSYTATLLSPTTSNLNSLASNGNYMLPSVSNTGWSSVQVATAFLNSLNLSSITTADQYTALQLAIWTVLYDWTQGNTPNTPTGNFTAHNLSSNIGSLLTSYLNLAEAFASGQNLNFGSWDLVLSGPSDSPNQVLIGMSAPEPQTYLLLGSLLSATLYYAKQKKYTQLNLKN